MYIVFISKAQLKGKLLTFAVSDRSLETIKDHICRIIYRFDNILMHVHNGKLEGDTSKDISGEKPVEILERIEEVIETSRAGSSKEVDLLPVEEEKLDDLDLDLLWVKADSKQHKSTISKEANDTPT